MYVIVWGEERAAFNSLVSKFSRKDLTCELTSEEWNEPVCEELGEEWVF